MKRFLKGMLAMAIAVCMMMPLLAACGEPADHNAKKPYEFEFNGSGVVQNGRTFNFTMTGLKEDGSLEIVADENDAIRVGGWYELMEDKGYKLCVDDTSGANGYARYNPSGFHC